MKKSEFKDLLSYIKTHPTDARLLAEALEQTSVEFGKTNPDVLIGNVASKIVRETPREEHAKAATCSPVVWMKAKDVAQVFGYRARWVNERRWMLPTEYVKMAKSGRGKPAWLYHPKVIELLGEWR